LPHKPKSDSDLPPDQLELDAKAILQWDVGRRTKWNSLEQPISNSPNSEKPNEELAVEQEESWISNVEINTSASHRALWMGPQFTFTTYQYEEAHNDPHYFF